jgi:gliding motility-associated-like protein
MKTIDIKFKCFLKSALLFCVFFLVDAKVFAQSGNLKNDNLSGININQGQMDEKTKKSDLHFDSNMDSYAEDLNIKINCDSLNPVKIILTMDTILTKPTEIVLTPRYGSIDGQWYPVTFLSCIDCQTPIAFPDKAITYTVHLRDQYQCLHTENFKIEFNLMVPNVITPNGDGFNDCLKIIGLPIGTPLKIYDKNGLLVYSDNQYDNSNCWSGTDNKGKPLDAGTYWYVLDNPIEGLYQKGFILLMR